MTTSSELLVHHRSGDCRIRIGRGLAGQTGNLIRDAGLVTGKGACAIITDGNVNSLYTPRLQTSLGDAGIRSVVVEVPAGEATKSLGQVGEVIDQLAAAGLDRHSFIVALGGGVIGDLAGFVAAIYYRGVPYVQIPTTVIAQCDSAIGGKTGINIPRAKNLVGAFHPASLVVVDPDLLRSLPPREFNEGFAEVIKHGIIADAALFRRCRVFDEGDLTAMITRNLEIKADIVNADEFETKGIRAKLNFGHTIGHGIEQAGGYGRLLHGEAISLGMVAASRLSSRKLGLHPDEVSAIVDLLKKFGLPTRLPADIATPAIMESLLLDKKFQSGAIRFVLAPKIGEAKLSDPGTITLTDLEEAVEELRS